MIKKIYIGLHVKYLLFLPDFNKTWIFMTDFQTMKYMYFMKICPVEAELFHLDRWTDMTKLIAAFYNF